MRSIEWLQYYRWVSQQPLTVVDVETTGSLAYNSRIMEISVLQATLENGILHQQTDLINPQMVIPARITQITGISQEMVSDAPLSEAILPDYLPLLRSGILTAHNLEFDYAFLRMEAARLGSTLLKPASEQLCTVQLARLLLTELPSRRLPDLVRHFRFDVAESHRAKADTLACWLLAKRLLLEILNEPDEGLLARFGQQWIPLKEAAKLLGCSPKAGRSRLEAAGITARSSQRRSSTLMYRRGEVERLYEELQPQEEPLQSSLFD